MTPLERFFDALDVVAELGEDDFCQDSIERAVTEMSTAELWRFAFQTARVCSSLGRHLRNGWVREDWRSWDRKAAPASADYPGRRSGLGDGPAAQ